MIIDRGPFVGLPHRLVSYWWLGYLCASSYGWCDSDVKFCARLDADATGFP